MSENPHSCFTFVATIDVIDEILVETIKFPVVNASNKNNDTGDR